MLASPQIEPKPRDHFVEDEDRPIRGTEVADAAEKTGQWLIEGHRLENNRGDLTGVCREERTKTLEIVIAKRGSQLLVGIRDARVNSSSPDEPIVHAEKGLVRARHKVASSRCSC